MKNAFVQNHNKQVQILLKSCTVFIEKSLKFIKATIQSGNLTKEEAKAYVKKILHSVFFIAHIRVPAFHPSDVLGEDNALRFQKKYPDVFEGYKTQLPLRPSYSVLLDVVVETVRDQNVHEILLELLKLNEEMHVPNNQSGICGNDFCLASTVVSFCYFEDDKSKKEKEKKAEPLKYFGASVACRGYPKLRNIFIDLSCIETWNRKVALGVCLAATGEKSILLPKTVRSAAFHMLNDEKDKDPEGSTEDIALESPPLDERPAQRYVPWPPCERCMEIFPGVEFSPAAINEDKSAYWKHGNCAECEAVSKLLNGERTVDERVVLYERPNEPLTDDSVRDLLNPLLEPKIKDLITTLKTAQFRLGQRFIFFRP